MIYTKYETHRHDNVNYDRVESLTCHDDEFDHVEDHDDDHK